MFSLFEQLRPVSIFTAAFELCSALLNLYINGRHMAVDFAYLVESVASGGFDVITTVLLEVLVVVRRRNKLAE